MLRGFAPSRKQGSTLYVNVPNMYVSGRVCYRSSAATHCLASV